jgi:hypothetical protein
MQDFGVISNRYNEKMAVRMKDDDANNNSRTVCNKFANTDNKNAYFE